MSKISKKLTGEEYPAVDHPKSKSSLESHNCTRARAPDHKSKFT